MVKASVLVVQGTAQGTRFEIGRHRVGVGRAAGNALRIPDSEVSRNHATIERDDEGYLLTDLGSVNGTFVNGEEVQQHRLADGDQLQVGATVLLFRLTAVPAVSENLPVDLVSVSDERSSIVEEVAAEGPGELLGAGSAGGSEAESLASLTALYRISDEVAHPSASLASILQGVLDVALDVVGADRGCVLTASPDGGEVVPRVFSHRGSQDGQANQSTMPIPRSIVDFVMDQGRGVRTSDAQHDDRFSGGRSILQAGVREALCAPMPGRQELLGVIYLDTTTSVAEAIELGVEGDRFTEESLRLLVAIGRQAALAVDGQRYQEALVKAERLAAVGQTIATLSHHIKNILQGVRGGSYLVNLGLKDHDEQLIGRGWDIVDRNQGRIYDLVMDMLTYSTERQPAWQNADINAVVEEVCELLKRRAEEAHVVLDCRVAEEPTAGQCDPDGIHRAVLNIVTNALDAVEGRPDGRVAVSAGVDGEVGWAYVDVEDNGTGIPDEQMASLFHLFASTKGARGTGLGLAVSRKIIDEHGGEIQVENRLGSGCRFRLTWPLEPPEAERSGEERETGVSPKAADEQPSRIEEGDGSNS